MAVEVERCPASDKFDLLFSNPPHRLANVSRKEMEELVQKGAKALGWSLRKGKRNVYNQGAKKRT